MKERPASSKPRWLVEPRFDERGVQISSGIAVDGREYADGVPLAPPVGYEAPTALESLIEQVLSRRDLRAALAAGDTETFEEADDFELEDEDYDPRFPETIYEAYFDAKSKRGAASVAASSGVDGKPESKVTAPEISPRGGADDKAQPTEKPAGGLKEDVR